MLKIVDLENNHLASVYVEDAEVKAKDVNESVREDLDSFLKRLVKGPVYLVGGKDEGSKKVLSRKEVQPKDEDYLRGVKDTITRSKLTLGGKRVRGILPV